MKHKIHVFFNIIIYWHLQVCDYDPHNMCPEASMTNSIEISSNIEDMMPNAIDKSSNQEVLSDYPMNFNPIPNPISLPSLPIPTLNHNPFNPLSSSESVFPTMDSSGLPIQPTQGHYKFGQGQPYMQMNYYPPAELKFPAPLSHKYPPNPPDKHPPYSQEKTYSPFSVKTYLSPHSRSLHGDYSPPTGYIPGYIPNHLLGHFEPLTGNNRHYTSEDDTYPSPEPKHYTLGYHAYPSSEPNHLPPPTEHDHESFAHTTYLPQTDHYPSQAAEPVPPLDHYDSHDAQPREGDLHDFDKEVKTLQVQQDRISDIIHNPEALDFHGE